MMDKILCRLCSFKRPGASLVNVCVFFLAATMITAQVFFFSTTTYDNLAEETKSVGRRFSMGQKLELAFDKLKETDIPSGEVSPEKIALYNSSGSSFKFFYPAACAWSDDAKEIYIYNLNYTLGNKNYAGDPDAAGEWDNAAKTPHKLIFPPMGAGYFLVRVLSEGQGLGKRLMYQVVVKRSVNGDRNITGDYIVKPLTFQEVWYE